MIGLMTSGYGPRQRRGLDAYEAGSWRPFRQRVPNIDKEALRNRRFLAGYLLRLGDYRRYQNKTGGT